MTDCMTDTAPAHAAKAGAALTCSLPVPRFIKGSTRSGEGHDERSPYRRARMQDCRATLAGGLEGLAQLHARSYRVVVAVSRDSHHPDCALANLLRLYWRLMTDDAGTLGACECESARTLLHSAIIAIRAHSPAIARCQDDVSAMHWSWVSENRRREKEDQRQ